MKANLRKVSLRTILGVAILGVVSTNIFGSEIQGISDKCNNYRKVLLEANKVVLHTIEDYQKGKASINYSFSKVNFINDSLKTLNAKDYCSGDSYKERAILQSDVTTRKTINDTEKYFGELLLNQSY